MTATTEAVAQTLDLLDRLVTDGVPPADTDAHLAPLRDRFPHLRFDLLPTTEPFGAVHYDALVREPDGRTVSLSVTSPSRGLPWPLRGAQRVGDRVLAEVDGQTLDIGEAVQLLDTLDDELAGGVADRLVTLCLVRAELDRRVSAMTPAEIDAAEAAFRRRHGLLDAEALSRWCRERSTDAEGLRRLAARTWVMSTLRRDGVDGLPFTEWQAKARADADVRWHWSMGRSASPETRR